MKNFFSIEKSLDYAETKMRFYSRSQNIESFKLTIQSKILLFRGIRNIDANSRAEVSNFFVF